MARVIKTVTEAYTVLDGDDGGIIIGNSSSPISITMPSAIGRSTFSLTVMNANGGTVTVLGQSISQNEEISIANSNNTWTYALGGGGSGTALAVLDSELTIALGSFFMGTGTIVVSGTTVTGTDTLFLSEAVVGEMIYGIGEDMIPLGIVSTISSDTVLSLYSAAPDYSGAVLIITPGDDSNPQGDPIEGFPVLGLATLTKAKEIIDSYDIFTKNAKVTIFVIPRAWSIDFSFMDYNIPISISAGGATTTGAVSFSNCPDVFIDGLSSSRFSFSSVDKVYLERTEATNGIYFGYQFGSVSMAEMYNCTLVDNSCTIGISAEKSNIYIEDVSGNATEYGMKSAYGSNIYKISSPYPTGTTSNELAETAGVIR
jgi:hypothetical protein